MKATEIHAELVQSLRIIEGALGKLPDTPSITLQTSQYRQILAGCAALVRTTLKLCVMLIEKERLQN